MDNNLPPGDAIRKLTLRFYSVKHRCGRDPHYYRVKFGFESAREAAEYMFAECGALYPGATVDRINGRRGYERGNLRYATMQEQLTNRRFKSRDHGASILLASSLTKRFAPFDRAIAQDQDAREARF
jgi:hypothetical protein